MSGERALRRMTPLMLLILTAPALGEDVHQKRSLLFQFAVSARDDPARARAQFAQVANLYAQPTTATECLNGGNAEYLAGHLPRAIYAYRVGLDRFDPTDARLRENLDYVRSQVHYPGALTAPALLTWPGWLPRPRTFWFAVLLLGEALACVALTRFALTGRSPLLLAACAVLLAGWAAVSLWADDERQRRATTHPVVVVATDSALHLGNGTLYPAHPDVPLVHAGMEARRRTRRGGWTQIEFEGGVVGWVPGSTLVDDDRSPAPIE